MQAGAKSPATVDAYIAGFAPDVQAVLREMRRVIAEAAPQATEGISYGMPGLRLNGRPLVYFAGWKTHIGLYATASGHAAFREELSAYVHAKGSVRFPLSAPMPWDLIRRIVAFRVAEASAAPAKRRARKD